LQNVSHYSWLAPPVSTTERGLSASITLGLLRVASAFKERSD
jgi:hypothetical protein